MMDKRHKAFSFIFIVEFWERFGYYGLVTLLAIYLVRSMGMLEAESFEVYGAFSALVFALVAFGGWIGDKILGVNRTLLLGATVLMIGYALISASHENLFFLYTGLATVAVGNGLFKANPSNLVAKIYAGDNAEMDTAFMYYYMAINLGSLVSRLGMPLVAAHYGGVVPFVLCTIGLFLSIVIYICGAKYTKAYDTEVGFAKMKIKKFLLVLVGIVFVIAICVFLLEHILIAKQLLSIIGIVVLIYYFYETFKEKGIARVKMLVALVLIIEAIAYFTVWMQNGTSLNFFAIHNSYHNILGWEFDPLMFQSLNAFWVIVLSPVFACLFSYLGKKGKTVPMPWKFSIGMALVAISLFAVVLGAKTADENGFVSIWWFVATYFFQTAGELLISGIGLAMVAQLVPERLHGFVMGAWFLNTTAAAFLGSWIATFVAAPKGITDPIAILAGYQDVFLKMAIGTAVLALIMICTSGWLNKLITQKEV